MGLLDKLLGRGKTQAPPSERGVLTIRDRQLAETLVRPKKAELVAEEAPECLDCGGPLAEVLITTFADDDQDELWRDVPVAVDGWSCGACGAFRYPRRMTPQQILAIEAEATQHGRAGRFVEAERCFVRVVWDWPGYVIGHANYADATRERLRHAAVGDERLRARLTQRIREQLEAAVAGHARESEPRMANVVAHAQLTLAEFALDAGDVKRARRAADECASLPGLAEQHRTRLHEILSKLPAVSASRKARRHGR
jgi:hypothetical protein